MVFLASFCPKMLSLSMYVYINLTGFCLYTRVSGFVFLSHFSVFKCFLCFFFGSFFVFSCLFFVSQSGLLFVFELPTGFLVEKDWIWMGVEVRRIWEDLREEKLIRIYCMNKNLFSIKSRNINKILKSLIWGWKESSAAQNSLWLLQRTVWSSTFTPGPSQNPVTPQAQLEPTTSSGLHK